MILSAQETLFLRLHAQRLNWPQNPITAPVSQVVEAVGGVQAQDVSAAGLSVRARCVGLTAAEVDKARQIDRSIIWTWALRGTLHFIAAADFYWMIPLLGPRFIAGNRSRYRQLELSEATLANGSRMIREALASLGPLTRAEIDSYLGAHSLQAEGQRLPHLIAYTALQGTVCHGADKDGEPTFVLASDWIVFSQPLPRQTALSELARRYLAAYAPAGAADLAAWSGTSLSEARQALTQIADQIVEVDAAGRPCCMLKAQVEWLDEYPSDSTNGSVVRLLPWFDTYLMGYADRSVVVDPVHWKRINPGGGMLHPTLLVDGRLAGVWSKKQHGDALLLKIEPFEDLDPNLRPYLEAEAEDIARYIGLKLELQIAPIL
jgi:hypothetical protein